jgi:spermidine/putrescine-binding protein
MNRDTMPSTSDSHLDKNSLTRRRFLGLLGGSVIAAPTFLSTRGAYAESPFIVSGTAGSWGDMLQQAFITGPRFAERNKVSVVFQGQSSGAVEASKIILNAGHPIFSVAEMDTNFGPNLAEAGCLAGYNPDLVPNLKYIPKQLLLEDPKLGTYFAAIDIQAFALVWNTKLAQRPTSWKDMWSSKYKGRVGVPAYDWEGNIWLQAVNKLFGGNEDNITPGIQAIAELVKKNNAVIFENVDQGMKAFQREEVVIAPFWNGRTFQLQGMNVPVAIEYVKNSIAVNDGFLIMRGTSYPDVAQRFINEALDGRNQLTITQKSGYPPSDPRVQLPPSLANHRLTPKDLENIVPLDWIKMGKNNNRDLERWNREVL